MRGTTLLWTAWCLASAAHALDTAAFLKHSAHHRTQQRSQKRETTTPPPRRNAGNSPFNNANTAKFAVNGSAIPEVDFNPGESYAGQLPIGNSTDANMFFWFWPTTAPERPKEIVIWLTGGPGCSSLSALLQENGPILWRSGVGKPVANPWSWHHLTNVVWVEQPVGTGFSTGPVTVTSEDDVARQFMDWWRNFVDAFALQGYKVYVTGESYAGLYCPYISSHFLEANDTAYFDLQGMLLYDAAISDIALQTQVTAHAQAEYWATALPLNDTAQARARNMSERCGYTGLVDKYLTFPSSGVLPTVEYGVGIGNETDCEVWDYLQWAAFELNPGFSVFQVTQLTPVPSDVLGLPYTFPYSAPGEEVYFDRPDVKAALHAPANVTWSICSNGYVFVDGFDNSLPSIQQRLPHVIEATSNVIIAHGMNDFDLMPQGTLLAIQNMTWNGKRGFERMPEDPLFVPLHWSAPGVDVQSASGQGVLGTTHTERGLSWDLVMLTGHQVPTWQPAVSFRQLEVLLGRVENMQSTKPFPMYPNEAQPDASELGKGTAPKLGRVVNGTA